jgi:hypothetical protein
MAGRALARKAPFVSPAPLMPLRMQRLQLLKPAESAQLAELNQTEHAAPLHWRATAAC